MIVAIVLWGVILCMLIGELIKWVKGRGKGNKIDQAASEEIEGGYLVPSDILIS